MRCTYAWISILTTYKRIVLYYYTVAACRSELNAVRRRYTNAISEFYPLTVFTCVQYSYRDTSELYNKCTFLHFSAGQTNASRQISFKAIVCNVHNSIYNYLFSYSGNPNLKTFSFFHDTPVDLRFSTAHNNIRVHLQYAHIIFIVYYYIY